MHCQPAAFLAHDAEGNPVSVKPSLFRVDPDGVSSNWLELCDGEDKFASLCAVLRGQRTVRTSHRVAIFQVQATKSLNDHIDVIHDPIEAAPENPIHSLITGIAPDDSVLLEALSLLAQLHPFAPPPAAGS